MSDRLKICPHSGNVPRGGSEKPHTKSSEVQGRVVRKVFSSQRGKWPEGRSLLKGSVGEEGLEGLGQVESLENKRVTVHKPCWLHGAVVDP